MEKKMDRQDKCEDIEGSIVQSCKVEGCSFNSHSKCHALAVTIGDGTHPRCDTFVQEGSDSGMETSTRVGACKVVSCVNNKKLICKAGFIDVIFNNDHPHCNKFQAKYLLGV